MSTVLKRLFKLLDQHEAQLSIDSYANPPELILSIPARVMANGTIARYALEYRLGPHLPQRPTPLFDSPDNPPASTQPCATNGAGVGSGMIKER